MSDERNHRVQVKHCRNHRQLKNFLNILDSDSEHVTDVEWQCGLSGYTVVYSVDPPGYNVRGGKPDPYAVVSLEQLQAKGWTKDELGWSPPDPEETE